MRDDMSRWREVAVLVQAEFDVLEMVKSGGLRLHEGRCSAVTEKAVSDLVARGFLIADEAGKLWMTDFGIAVSASVQPTASDVCFRGKSQRVYTLSGSESLPRRAG